MTGDIGSALTMGWDSDESIGVILYLIVMRQSKFFSEKRGWEENSLVSLHRHRDQPRRCHYGHKYN
jgi:hypothetical protein